VSDFARLASFDGRARRSTFWWAVIGAILVVLAPVSTDGLLSMLGLPNWSPTALLDGPEAGWAVWQQLVSVIYVAVMLPTMWLLLATLVRRCHDRNWSGAFLLVGLIPIVQLWPLVELALLDGAPGDNAYGPSPKPLLDEALPMQLERSELEAPLPVAAESPAVIDDPFASPAEPPVPAHGFEDAPLTLEGPSEEGARQVDRDREPRVPLILAPIVKYARFDGRATRSEYWLFVLLQWVLLVGVVAALTAALPPGRDSAPFMVMGVATVLIGLLLPNLAVTSRRLHDSGLSFAWWLVSFIPVIGGVITLVMMCLGGTRGSNAYGPDPRYA
jgi:uncharacterized membrane protein YhaH (DUF805 family)